MGDARSNDSEKNGYPFIEVIVFDNAYDFISYLDLKNDRWGEGFRSSWIFRGQRNSEWKLLPSAWRDPGFSLLEPLRIELEQRGNHLKSIANHAVLRRVRFSGDPIPCLLQAAAEHKAVSLFAERADEIGLPAYQNDEAEKLIEKYFCGCSQIDLNTDFYDGPTHEHGLAQHHGIPTRLLDWTRNPKIAAFFAVEELVRNTELIEEGLGISVWAIDLESIDQQVLRVMTCLRSEHTFLHAQDGLFLWSPVSDQYYHQCNEWPCFEDLLSLYQTSEGRRFAGPCYYRSQYSDPVVRKVVLKTGKAG